MSEDIFESIAKFEKQADEVVERAKAQAREFREEVDRKLKALADQLERDYGKQREEIELVMADKREKLFKEFEAHLRAGLARLDKARQEKLAPLIERVIEAFLEGTDGY